MNTFLTAKNKARQLFRKRFYRYLIAVLLIPIFVISLSSAFWALEDCFLLITGMGEELYAAFSVLETLLHVFLVCPLFYGCALFFAEAAENGQTPDLGCLFAAFASPETYARSFRLLYAVLWRFLLTFAVPLCLVFQWENYLFDRSVVPFTFSLFSYDMTYTLLCAAVILAAFLAFAVFSRFIPGICYTVTMPRLSVSRCFMTGTVALFGKKTKLFFACFSFFPLYLLTFLTFGLSLLIYTLPLILLTLFCYASTLQINSQL